MLLAAEEPLRGKDVRVDLLNQLRYMLSVFMGFFTNPFRNLRITRRVITLRHPNTQFVHIFLMLNELHNLRRQSAMPRT